MYFNISLEVDILTHIASPSFSYSSIIPIPSICPDTICPPNLSPIFNALSKLTLLPFFLSILN